MKSLTQTILDEQIKPNRVPALKVQVQSYDYPDKSDFVKFNEYDWDYAHKNALTVGAKACVANNGSLVLYDGARTVSIANASHSSDYTSWAATATPEHFHPCKLYSIIANPTSAEVLKFAVTTNAVICYTSTDNGATFDAGTTLTCYYNHRSLTGSFTPIAIAAAYKSNGDVCLAAETRFFYSGTNPYPNQDTLVHFMERISGSWVTTGGDPSCYGWRKMLIPFTSDESFFYRGHSFAEAGGTIAYSISTVTNISLAHDGDWICTVDFHNYSWNESVGTTTVTYGTPIIYKGSFANSDSRLKYGIYGDGETIADRQTAFYGDIVTSSSKAEISSIKDVTHFSGGSGSTVDVFKPYGDGVSLLRERQAFDISGLLNPASHLFKLPNYPLILSVSDGNNVHFLTLDDDSTVAGAIFTNAKSIPNVYPLDLCAGSNYIFAYNGNQIYVSPLPASWAYPVVGTGAGASSEYTSILKVAENRRENLTSTLDVYFNNSAGTFNSIPATLAVGSRLNLFLGFNISTVDTTIEYSRYFVDSWEYTFSPNLPLFVIHCVDAWGLLERYKFNKVVKFNLYQNDYSAYSIIDWIVKAIGGTTTYLTRSSFITTFYPKLEVTPNGNAADLLRRILEKTGDTVRFFGNDATIINPLSTDSAQYYYLGVS
jgi:hypothetical protein